MNGARERIREEPNIELRPLTEDRVEEFWCLVNANRESVSDELPVDAPYSIEDAKEGYRHAQELGWSTWGIYQDQKLIGHINFRPEKKLSDTAEVGYLVDKDARGQEVAPTALRRILQTIPEQYRVIHASPKVTNEASQRVLQKAGFVFWEPTRDGHVTYLYLPQERRQPTRTHEA